MGMVTAIYRCTRDFPDDERFGLVSQLRRAAVSVPSNIAEGKGRASDRDLLHFLVCARGSINEVQTQLEIAEALGYASHDRLRELYARAVEIARLLNGLIKALRPTSTSQAQSPKPEA